MYAQSEYGDAVELVLQGEMERRLPTGRYHYKRIAKIGPGGYFGNVAFLTPGSRSTSAEVTSTAQLLVLDRAALRTLEGSSDPEAARHTYLSQSSGPWPVSYAGFVLNLPVLNPVRNKLSPTPQFNAEAMSEKRVLFLPSRLQFCMSSVGYGKLTSECRLGNGKLQYFLIAPG